MNSCHAESCTHLQHCVGCPRCRRLLAAAQLAKGAAILLAQPLEVSNLGVRGKRLQPAGHMCLQQEQGGWR